MGACTALSHYQLFGPIKVARRRKIFANKEKVKAAVKKWLLDQPKQFYDNGINKLQDRSDKCMNVGVIMLKKNAIGFSSDSISDTFLRSKLFDSLRNQINYFIMQNIWIWIDQNIKSDEVND